VGLALWALTTLYIAVLPTRHYTPDASNNLLFIESQNGFELWHSQHLLAQWPGYWTYQLAGGQLRAWQAMRIAHALLAGATVALVYATVLELTQAPRIAVGSGLALWVSYGFWHYQSDPDIYSAGYAAVALLMLLYIRYLRAPGTGRAIALGLSAALAVLMHQLTIELAGLIGLSLLVYRTRKQHIALYAILCLLIPLALYGVGWMFASRYLVQQGGTAPGFAEWGLGYFGTAQAGEATWGVSFNLRTLPTAVYTFILSWILPPSFNTAALPEIILFGALLIGAGILFLHMLYALRLPMPQRLMARVCGLVLIANGISGWWWQTGNVKFYLFMQIPLILVTALYAQQVLDGWQRWLRRAALGGVVVMLAAFHILFTLPYETNGGVFAVAHLSGDTPTLVWFENPDQAGIYTYITPYPGHVLPDDFCNRPPSIPTRWQVWWVVHERDLFSCDALASYRMIGRFQADRSRDVWVIYDVTPAR
jgi:hypothetical protein